MPSAKDLEDYLPFDLPPNLRSLPDKIYLSAQSGVEDVHDVLEKSLDTIFKATQSLIDAITSSSKPVLNRPDVHIPESSSSSWTYFSWISDVKKWTSEHKFTTLVLTALGTTVVILIIKETRKQRIKAARARRRHNKSKDVVVVTGVETPLGHCISTYLSKRGFVVFAASADETAILSLDKPDLRGLLLDPNNSQSLANVKSVLASALAPPSSLVSQRDKLSGSSSAPKFLGLVHTIPTTLTSVAQAPLESITSAQYQHAITHPLIATTTTLQTILPVMRRTLNRQSTPKPTYYPHIILLFPTLPTPARIKLQMPYTTAGVASHMSMVGLAASLRRELAPIGIGLTSVHLGFTEGATTTLAAPYDMTSISEPSDDINQAYKQPLEREIHSVNGLDSARVPTSHQHIASKVYDMLVMAGEGGRQPPAKGNIGTGAAVYDFFGSWMPTFNVDLISGSWWQSNMRRRTNGYDSDEDYVSV